MKTLMYEGCNGWQGRGESAGFAVKQSVRKSLIKSEKYLRFSLRYVQT